MLRFFWVVFFILQIAVNASLAIASQAGTAAMASQAVPATQSAIAVTSSQNHQIPIQMSPSQTVLQQQPTQPTNINWHVLIMLSVIWLVFYGYGGFRSKRILWLKTVTERFTTHVGPIFSGITISLGLLILFFWLALGIKANGYELDSSPGLFFALAAFSVTMAGFLNTNIIRVRQASMFSGFDALLAKFHEIEEQGVASAHQSPAILIDYSCHIGDISNEKVADEIVGSLTRMKTRHYTMHIVVLPENKLREYYSSFLEDEAARSKVNASEATLLDLARKHLGNVAIWRSTKIHTEHYFVSHSRAIQYLVVRAGKRNELIGDSTMDVRRLGYLADSAQDYIRQAITPICTWNDSCASLAWEVEQFDVKEIHIFQRADPNFSEDLENPIITIKSRDNSPTLLVDGKLTNSPYKCNGTNGTLAHKNWIIVRVVKNNGLESPYTRPIFIDGQRDE